MKIRIQDNSVRLRITLRELETFETEGCLSRRMQVLDARGLGPSFCYSLVFAPDLAASEVALEPMAITVRLGPADRAALLREDEEGITIRREWVAQDATIHRFMALVEKDRPGSTCVKKEQWIYDAPPNGAIETRPIPKAPVRTG